MVNKLIEDVQSLGIINTINDVIEEKTDWYGTSSTAKATQTKLVTCDGFKLKTGTSIRVKFSDYQAYSGTPKLNVNGTGAYNIASSGSTGAGRYYWRTGEIISFTFDGANWIIEDGGVADTTYYGYTRLNSSATSSSSVLSLTPSALNSVVHDMIEPYAVYSESSTYALGSRVRYEYKAWECTTAITKAEAWNENHWTVISPIQTQLDNKVNTSSIVSTVSQSSTNAEVVGAKLFYDTIGNIESLLSQI